MSTAEQIKQAIGDLPPAQQQRVLEFVRALQRRLQDEDAAVGEVGAKLIAEVLEPEDFSHWESKADG